MMVEIVNLRQARRRRARDAKAANAAENRTRFGRTTAEKRRDADSTARIGRRLDGSRRDRSADRIAPAETTDRTPKN